MHASKVSVYVAIIMDHIIYCTTYYQQLDSEFPVSKTFTHDLTQYPMTLFN